MAATFPTVFVSHGAPTLYMHQGPTHDFLKGLGRELGQPKAVVCFSAHWTTRSPQTGSAARPSTIYDFYGFPDAMYRVQYPAPGHPALADRVMELLGAHGLPAAADDSRGLDHGAWAPLALMYPAADTPVVQVSVQPGLDPAHHLAMGQALRPLRDEGVLLLGSGGAAHNLADLRPYATPPVPYAMEFDDWLARAVAEDRRDDLCAYLETAPQGPRNHPTAEHFLPLFPPMGAAEGPGRRLHAAFTYGVLSMAAFAWD